MSSISIYKVSEESLKWLEDQMDFIKGELLRAMKRGDKITFHNIPHITRMDWNYGMIPTGDLRLDGYTYAISVGEYPEEIK